MRLVPAVRPKDFFRIFFVDIKDHTHRLIKGFLDTKHRELNKYRDTQPMEMKL